MSTISVFYQCESHNAIEHVAVSSGATIADVLAAILAKHTIDPDACVFLEDKDDPIEKSAYLKDIAGPKGAKVHVHRCVRVKVSVTFNGKSKEHAFAPSATIARVKRWATDKAFEMSPAEAAEHVLQIAGTTDRPSPATHVGTLAKHPHCHVHFDLVPNERVNGASDGRA